MKIELDSDSEEIYMVRLLADEKWLIHSTKQMLNFYKHSEKMGSAIHHNTNLSPSEIIDCFVKDGYEIFDFIPTSKNRSVLMPNWFALNKRLQEQTEKNLPDVEMRIAELYRI